MLLRLVLAAGMVASGFQAAAGLPSLVGGSGEMAPQPPNELTIICAAQVGEPFQLWPSLLPDPERAGLECQWFKNGVPIPGENQGKLTFPRVRWQDEGLYQARVTLRVGGGRRLVPTPKYRLQPWDSQLRTSS